MWIKGNFHFYFDSIFAICKTHKMTIEMFKIETWKSKWKINKYSWYWSVIIYCEFWVIKTSFFFFFQKINRISIFTLSKLNGYIFDIIHILSEMENIKFISEIFSFPFIISFTWFSKEKVKESCKVTMKKWKPWA